MNKTVKRALSLLLCAATAFPLISGCKPKGSKKANDTETRPVVVATEALDGNFNPFFATSAGDSEMVGMTQLGMLTTDDVGNITYGQEEPTVTLDYQKKESEVDGKKYTDYSFIIKKGLKFSDGVDLTIKDVLFNLYVYLDPEYTGSATMYSTDIVGLKSYRAQDASLSDDSDITDSDLNATFEAAAIQRQNYLISYLDTKERPNLTEAQKEQAIKDIELAKELFREEVESDWTSCQGQLESYKDEYTFTEDWQVYYYNEGLITPWRSQGKAVKDVNGKYITNITPVGATYEVEGKQYTYNGEHYNEELITGITAEMNDTAKIQAYLSENENATEADAKAALVKAYAIDTVYGAYTATESGILSVVTAWATASNIYERFVSEARTEWFEKLSGHLTVPTISGITTSKTNTDFSGKSLGTEYDVLNIKINGVDPKAEYNFAFGVAPLHYYSGKYTVQRDGVDTLVDFVAEADGVTNFGVSFSNEGFFREVLRATEKNMKPVGAGAYQASNSKGQVGDIKGSGFNNNGWVYFARNDHFYNVFGNDKSDNAKIKYVRYKVVSTDSILYALQSEEIDIGEPNAKPDVLDSIYKAKNLEYITVDTNGYGYVGINPKWVPDIEVRRAIMMAMDPKHCISYYSENNASILYRSMSKTSWIWKYVDMPTESYYPLAMTSAEIKELVEQAGWKMGTDGKYAKDGKKLDYTFIIAGATEDHPAFAMFSIAADFLNQECGFDVTVKKSANALKDLASGGLEVWAAAWSSTVDPDMYQVYHKDSKATSVKNWGYDEIKKDTTGQYDYEKSILDDLSKLIDEARETNDQEIRSKKYEQALNFVMELAVEMPTYQRKDCVAYNSSIIDYNSLNSNPSPYAGVIDKIWELDYV